MGGKMEAIVLVLVIGAAVMGGFAQVLFKKGMTQLGEITISQAFKEIFKLFTNHFVFAGLLLYVVSTIIYLTALSRGELSALYPLISISYVVAGGLSVFLLGEKISLTRWIGIITIVIGVFLVVRG
ncbi:MAG: EamA family transporter, partial [Nanoarchaeota archaeon]|nr:EamA family transporter [Nanoarchaeota archaeon]